MRPDADGMVPHHFAFLIPHARAMASFLLKLTNTNAGRSISHALIAFFGALLPMIDLTNVSGLHAALIAAIPAALAVAFRSLSPSLHPAGTQVSVADVDALITSKLGVTVAKVIADLQAGGLIGPSKLVVTSGDATVNPSTAIVQTAPAPFANVNTTDTSAYAPTPAPTAAPDVQIVDTAPADAPA